eukprot:3940500-Rhodomonas_salina.2
MPATANPAVLPADSTWLPTQDSSNRSTSAIVQDLKRPGRAGTRAHTRRSLTLAVIDPTLAAIMIAPTLRPTHDSRTLCPPCFPALIGLL